ncbi:hypothetical protein BH10PSE14_BH10PSE14_25450 [soil metagenome]
MGAAEALGGLRQDVLGGALCVRQYVRVPETDDSPTLALQIDRAPLICCRLFGMLTTVELDPEPCRTAREIDDERGHYQLAGKGWPIS